MKKTTNVAEQVGRGNFPLNPSQNRAVTLSLLFDCSLFFHEDQFKLIEDKLSAYTVGSLLKKCRVEAFVFLCKRFITFKRSNIGRCKNGRGGVRSIYGLRISKKHMVGTDLGQMEAQTNALRYRPREETPIAA